MGFWSAVTHHIIIAHGLAAQLIAPLTRRHGEPHRPGCRHRPRSEPPVPGGSHRAGEDLQRSLVKNDTLRAHPARRSTVFGNEISDGQCQPLGLSIKAPLITHSCALWSRGVNEPDGPAWRQPRTRIGRSTASV